MAGSRDITLSEGNAHTIGDSFVADRANAEQLIKANAAAFPAAFTAAERGVLNLSATAALTLSGLDKPSGTTVVSAAVRGTTTCIVYKDSAGRYFQGALDGSGNYV